MQRFGVSEMVPSQTRQPSDVSTAGSVGVSRLNLATPMGTNRSSALDVDMNSESAERSGHREITDPITRTSNGTLEMEIADSEDEDAGLFLTQGYDHAHVGR